MFGVLSQCWCCTAVGLTTLDLSPLCIEEFDLSDKNFKPCPCGYQVSYSLHICLPAALWCALAQILTTTNPDLPILLQQHQDP